MSKYTPLQRYLSGRSEVEGVVDFAFPSATTPYRAWWSNGSPDTAWLLIGFRSAQVDRDNQVLRFVRADEPRQLPAPARDVPVIDALRQALAGTVRFIEEARA